MEGSRLTHHECGALMTGQCTIARQVDSTQPKTILHPERCDWCWHLPTPSFLSFSPASLSMHQSPSRIHLQWQTPTGLHLLFTLLLQSHQRQLHFSYCKIPPAKNKVNLCTCSLPVPFSAWHALGSLSPINVVCSESQSWGNCETEWSSIKISILVAEKVKWLISGTGTKLLRVILSQWGCLFF